MCAKYRTLPYIKNAIEQSRHLIVLCSPESATSLWVNEEVKHFLATHDNDYNAIVPVILNGEPGSGAVRHTNWHYVPDGITSRAIRFRFTLPARNGKSALWKMRNCYRKPMNRSGMKMWNIIWTNSTNSRKNLRRIFLQQRKTPSKWNWICSDNTGETCVYHQAAGFPVRSRLSMS